MLTHNKMIKSIYGGILSFLIALGLGCQQSNDANKHAEAIAQQTLTPVQTERQDGLEEAYFASGCFWCVEGIYEEILVLKKPYLAIVVEKWLIQTTKITVNKAKRTKSTTILT